MCVSGRGGVGDVMEMAGNVNGCVVSVVCNIPDAINGSLWDVSRRLLVVGGVPHANLLIVMRRRVVVVC